MNILYVITKSERGGAQQHVRDLAIGFVADGHRVTVAIGSHNGWLQEQLHERGIATEVVRLKRTWNPFSFFAYFFDLAKVIRRIRPDIVHFHSSHALIGTWIVRLFFPCTRSVVTIHGLSLLYQGASRQSLQILYALFLKMVLLCADRVLCVCQFDQDLLSRFKLVSEDHAEVIHNGIDQPFFLLKEDARSELGLAQDEIVIGTIARFSFQKNVSLLINAFLKWNHPTAKLCLIGSGPEENMLRQVIKDSGLHDRILFSQGDATILKAFSVFVLSSRYEGFPYVLLEAALAEVPIIATNVGGVPELIDQNKTGWLVPSGDVDALVRSIEDAMTHPDQASVCVQAAHDRVEKEFSKSIMINKIQEVYALLQ